MRTVTFYSYKGGVGRSLALANMARYLATLGYRVAAMDLDLEAPGLTWKLLGDGQSSPEKGVVDLLVSAAASEGLPSSILDFTIEIKVGTDSGTVLLLPAGSAPHPEYWKKLGQVDWFHLFRSEDPAGVPFFLELKERIRDDLKPDYLLIDARTGITEMGGIATTVLADQIVCLLAHNRENLEGARAVLRSIRQAPRLESQSPADIVPVLARIPFGMEAEKEQAILNSVCRFLNEPAEDLHDTLALSEVYVLHSYPDLQLDEKLLVGQGSALEKLPLLRDYLRLAGRVAPAERQYFLRDLIKRTLDGFWDDPTTAEANLRAIADSYPHAESYLALLKLYRGREKDDHERLWAAQRYWLVRGAFDDPVVSETIAKAKEWTVRNHQPCNVELIEAWWRHQPEKTAEYLLRVMAFFATTGEHDRGRGTLRSWLESQKDELAAIEKVYPRLAEAGAIDEALAVLTEMSLSDTAILRAQYLLVLRAAQLKKHEGARRILESFHFEDDVFLRRFPITYLRLHETAKSGPRGAQVIADAVGDILSAMRSRLDSTALEDATKDLRNALQPYDLGNSVDVAVQRAESSYGADDDIPF